MTRVSCAVILKDNKYLAVQRSAKMDLPFQWEFPGGKIKENETEEESLKREIKEELNVEVTIIKRLNSNLHSYPNKTIELIPFVCSIPLDNIQLTEHIAKVWLTKEELKNLDWCAADVQILDLL